MPIGDVPIFSMLRTRMQWHQERQRLLAENVANADTPNFRPRDLAPPKFDTRTPAAGPLLALMQTTPGHVSTAGANATGGFQVERRGGDVRPGGNGVSLEDEMLKVANNQMDFQTATSLYSRSLGLIKTALGKR